MNFTYLGGFFSIKDLNKKIFTKDSCLRLDLLTIFLLSILKQLEGQTQRTLYYDLSF